MQVSVDLELCQAYANCVLAAPEVFDLDESESHAVVLAEHPDDQLRPKVEEAVRSCPVRAIMLHD